MLIGRPPAPVASLPLRPAPLQSAPHRLLALRLGWRTPVAALSTLAGSTPSLLACPAVSHAGGYKVVDDHANNAAVAAAKGAVDAALAGKLGGAPALTEVVAAQTQVVAGGCSSTGCVDVLPCGAFSAA